MSGWLLLAMALSGAACWAWCRPPPSELLVRRLRAVAVPGPFGDARSWPRRWIGRLPARMVSGLGRTRSREQQARWVATIELCGAVAEELRAGRLPADALLVSLRPGADVAGHAARAARGGHPIGPALALDAGQAGAAGLRLVAACWTVAEQHGGALAAALDRVAAALRAQELAERRVALELAAPQATARLLAALPVLGLVIGTASGADPIRVLLGTGPGWLLLATGVGLDLAGLAWVRRIARTGRGTDPLG
ncbi:MAG: type II secretion system F family protein [Sporichthyaceae bacterium]|nr:type II secretion system F family protein [Sporichthyaceae bacterium]